MDSLAQPEHTDGIVSATPGTSGASPVRNRMVSRVHTVAFNGIDVLDIDCQVQLSSGDAAATPTIRLAVDTIPSLAPRTAARSQPMR
jgi:hypothetical protein